MITYGWFDSVEERVMNKAFILKMSESVNCKYKGNVV